MLARTRRRRLASVTWDVSFLAVASLAAVGEASPSAFAAALTADLSDPSFASAVAVPTAKPLSPLANVPAKAARATWPGFCHFIRCSPLT